MEVTAGCIESQCLYNAYAVAAAASVTTTILAAAASNVLSGALPAAALVLKYASMSLSREARAGSGPLPALNQSTKKHNQTTAIEINTNVIGYSAMQFA
jgi:hypothetical protein